MKICDSCGYYIPEKAKKCAYCGQGLLGPRWLRSTPFLVSWKILATLISCSSLMVLFFIGLQTVRLGEQTEIIKRRFGVEYIPYVRIGPISFNAKEYNEEAGGVSVYTVFVIPIENRQGIAVDVDITKKTIRLSRGTYGLETPSLQSSLTQNSFNLPDGQIKYDTIVIDMSPTYYKQYLTGEASFSLEYEIRYKALSEVTDKTFVYNYKVEYSQGRFNVIQEDTTRK